RVVEPVHTEGHDVGRSVHDPGRPGLPGLDVLGVPSASVDRPHPALDRSEDRLEVSMTQSAAPADAPARRRGPVDPRLWRYSAAARGYLVLTVVTSVVDVVMVVVTALMIGRVLAGVITTDARSVGDWTTELAILAVAIVVRVAVTWLQSRYAHRSATRVVAELEHEVLDSAANLPPRELDPRRDEIAVVLTRGLDGLKEYLTGYLPALL